MMLVAVQLDENTIAGLSPEVIMELVAQGNWELQQWSDKIFGKPQERAYVYRVSETTLEKQYEALVQDFEGSPHFSS